MLIGSRTPAPLMRSPPKLPAADARTARFSYCGLPGSRLRTASDALKAPSRRPAGGPADLGAFALRCHAHCQRCWPPPPPTRVSSSPWPLHHRVLHWAAFRGEVPLLGRSGEACPEQRAGTTSTVVGPALMTATLSLVGSSGAPLSWERGL
jgi:hypothetical protein